MEEFLLLHSGPITLFEEILGVLHHQEPCAKRAKMDEETGTRCIKNKALKRDFSFVIS